MTPEDTARGWVVPKGVVTGGFLVARGFSLPDGHPLSRQESEDAVKALAKEKDLLEREKWELRRQAKEATDHASALRSQLDLKDNRMKELEAELAMVSWIINTDLSAAVVALLQY